jgi:hypothetical protein
MREILELIINFSKKSVWFFPLVLAFVFLILSAARISGTSIGVYHKTLYGAGANDPDLLYGQPNPVRSDEWLVSTQLTISQSEQNFPRINENIGNGKDMSLVAGAPYKDWSTIFKPENLAFLIAPLEIAFAFKWWFLFYLLIVSCYFFTLRIVKDKRLFATLFSLAVGFSPFVFWWYTPQILAPLSYGFFIMTIFMRIISGEPVKFLAKKKSIYSLTIYTFTIAYLLMSFALVLYPPFQISIAIVVGFFMIGYILNNKSSGKKETKVMAKRLSVFAMAVLLSIMLLGLFVATRRDAINTVSNTVYPGARITTSGGINYLNVFDSFLQPQLQNETRGSKFFKNQSEASNFILLSPFLALPAIFISIYEFKKKRRIDWLFVMVQLCVLLFFARVFLPVGDPFYKLLLLNRVPHERLIIGIGFVSILLTLLLLKKLMELKFPNKVVWSAATAYTLICFAIVSFIGFSASHEYPLFISYTPKILALAACFCAIIFLILTQRIVLAATALLVFSFASVYRVHPLYRGLGWIKSNNLYTSMQIISNPQDTWVGADYRLLEDIGLLANRHTISGVQPYPDLKLWNEEYPDLNNIYNRYAHILFVSNPNFKSPLKLVAPDFYEVSIQCNSFTETRINFILDINFINEPCLRLEKKIIYPSTTFYIYRVVKTTNQH